MERADTLDRGGGVAASGSASPSAAGLLDEAKSLWRDLRGLAYDQLALAALETKLAGRSLVTMIGTAVLIAALLISAWLGLMGAVVLWLVGVGVAATIAVLVAVSANLLLALLLYYVSRRLSRHLQFPATMRSLRALPASFQSSEKPR